MKTLTRLPDFEKVGGLLPVIVQDAATRTVLMLGYMNAEALEKTQQEGRVTFFSRSKQRLWTKGETSGHFLTVVSMALDCDRDTLLIQAQPAGPVCHTGADTCFEAKNVAGVAFLETLQGVIDARKTAAPDSSYTAHLFSKGVNKIAQKVGEEAVEVVIEAKDDNLDLFKNECADLLYHLQVLLSYKGIGIGDIAAVLAKRHQK